jgi:subtilase family serine protease
VPSAPRRSLLLFTATLLLLFGLAGPAGARPAGVSTPTGVSTATLNATRDACAPVTAGFARCFAKMSVTTTASGTFAPLATSPIGYVPADLLSAYALPSGGSGQTIAIVDAFDDPNAESDLAQYRAQFGLAPCTTANGCFRKVNQTGGTTPPASDVGWAEEISLDVDMVSAICPSCNILLVEATTNSLANLGAAVDEAAALGAQAISNSYGAGETGTSSFEFHYNHPGRAITVSSGDSGFAREFPASSPHVTAVGGTSLSRASNSRGWTETAWSGAGSGCSRIYAKPAWQLDTGCARRTIADVSAVADPATGVAVYDTFGVSGGPWFRFGGTSVSAPIIAAVYGLAGNGGSVNYGSFPYAHTGSLFDVVGGSNGHCNPSYLCTAVTGYDGPTGLGTPNGAGAF